MGLIMAEKSSVNDLVLCFVFSSRLSMLPLIWTKIGSEQARPRDYCHQLQELSHLVFLHHVKAEAHSLPEARPHTSQPPRARPRRNIPARPGSHMGCFEDES